MRDFSAICTVFVGILLYTEHRDIEGAIFCAAYFIVIAMRKEKQ